MKKQIAIICGGQSAEHAVSLLSAANVIRDLDTSQFDKRIIYITRQGQWCLASDEVAFLAQAQAMHIDITQLVPLSLQPGNAKYPLLDQATQTPIAIDCFFPVLHGTKGEDGSMQGLFDILNVAYVGCNTVSSAMCMEKHITKQLFRHTGIPTLDWITLDISQKDQFSYDDMALQFGDVFFIKTVSSGSSIGVSKVRNEQEYRNALEDCFYFDNYLIIEPAVNARELEVAVLGNAAVQTAAPGEVIVHDDFYTYEAKYFNPEASEVVTPADISQALSETLQMIAKKAFQVLRCSGMARIDFFAVSDDEVYLNEINPLPGFTNISMYPKSWMAAGLSYKELLSRLIELAIERHSERQTIHGRYEKFIAEQREKYSAV